MTQLICSLMLRNVWILFLGLSVLHAGKLQVSEGNDEPSPDRLETPSTRKNEETAKTKGEFPSLDDKVLEVF